MKKIINTIFLISLFNFNMVANTLEEIKTSKEVRIAISTINPPFSSLKDGKYVGFEVDLAKKIGEYLVGNGGKITFIGLTNPTQKVKYLNDNTADIVVANFLKTDELVKKVDFSMPYFSVTMAALTPKNLNINDIKQLNKVAVKNGFSPAINTVKKLMPTAKMVEVKDNDEAWDLIKKGEVQGYVNTNLVVMGYPIMDDSLVVSPRKIGKNLFLSPGVKKGNKELQKEINEIMFQLANEGYFEKIFNDTFGDFYKGVVEAKDFLLQDLYSNF